MHPLLESCLPYLTWYNHQLYYAAESESGNLLRPKQSYGCFWCLILFENDRQQLRGTKCQPVGLIVLSPTGLYVCVCRVLFTRPYIITSIVKPLKLIICLILDGYQSHDSKTTLWGLTWFRNQPQVFNFVQCFCVFKVHISCSETRLYFDVIPEWLWSNICISVLLETQFLSNTVKFS